METVSGYIFRIRDVCNSGESVCVSSGVWAALFVLGNEEGDAVGGGHLL